MNNKTKQKFERVAVLMGGTSCERAVSLMSGQNVLDALLRNGVDAYAIDVDKNIIKKLQSNKPDRVFIALHGTNGEDGVIQGVLEMLNIPYSGSGIAASALTMDKYRCGLFWQSLGLPVLPSAILNEDGGLDPRVRGDDKYDNWCVKPIDGGSSVGVSRVTDIAQLAEAYNLAKQHGSQVMIQPWIVGREFTVGILGAEALPVIEIVAPQNCFYDYEAKYFSDKTGYIIPCNLTVQEQNKLQDLAMQAFISSGCRHWGRIDFMRDKQGQFWLLEANTVPGLTSHSLVPMAAKHIGISFDELIIKVLGFTIE